jgi:hypothetical protein
MPDSVSIVASVSASLATSASDRKRSFFSPLRDLTPLAGLAGIEPWQARSTEGYAHLAADPLLAVADSTAARIAAAMKRRLDANPEIIGFHQRKT